VCIYIYVYIYIHIHMIIDKYFKRILTGSLEIAERTLTHIL